VPGQHVLFGQEFCLGGRGDVGRPALGHSDADEQRHDVVGGLFGAHHVGAGVEGVMRDGFQGRVVSLQPSSWVMSDGRSGQPTPAHVDVDLYVNFRG
jgi:hypothetical protein